MSLPEDRRYAETHEWCKLEAGECIVGLTQFAADQLTDITFVELPEVGSEIAKGDEACAIESCKAAASVYAPAGGEVSAVNETLEDQPELVNSDPYEGGWILKMKIADASELDGLMDAAGYEKFLEESAE